MTRDITLPHAITEAADIRKTAGECLKRVELTQRIRLLGVRASGLLPLNEVAEPAAPIQGELPF